MLFRSRRGILVWTAFVASAFVAFSIREYTAIPTAAALLTAFLAARRRGDARATRSAVVGAAVFAVAAVALLAFWRTVPNPKTLHPVLPTGHSIEKTWYKASGLVRLTGLWLVPIIVWAGPRRIVRRAYLSSQAGTIGLVLVASAWLGSTGLHAPRVAFAGNYVMPNGALSNDVSTGVRTDIIPPHLFTFLTALGTAGAVLLLLACVPTCSTLMRTRRRPRAAAPLRDPIGTMLSLTVAGYTIVYAGAALTGLPLYDRYVLPVVPIVAILTARTRSDAPHRIRHPADPAAGLRAVHRLRPAAAAGQRNARHGQRPRAAVRAADFLDREHAGQQGADDTADAVHTKCIQRIVITHHALESGRTPVADHACNDTDDERAARVERRRAVARHGLEVAEDVGDLGVERADARGLEIGQIGRAHV